MTYFHEGEGRYIEQLAREFCQNVIRKDFDEFVKAKQFNREVFEKMGRVGFLGAMIPEEYGGAGMSMKNYAILMESVACYGGGSIALTLTAHHSLAASHIIHAGTEEQKRIYLPKLASGEMIGAWCLTEPNAGSDAFGGMRTTAMPVAGDCWIINGPKQFVTGGSIADVYVVMARILTDNPAKREYGVFLIERGAGNIQCRPETNKMGMHASDTAAVVFENVVIGSNLKMAGDGRKSTVKVLENGRVGISALACGLLRSALSEAIDYAKQRKAFGKTISEYQSVTDRLAGASADLNACWALVEKAALAVDEDKLTSKLASETKLKVTEDVVARCFDVLRTFGGYGYIEDNRATQDYLDAVLLVIGEGTSDIQRQTITKALFSE